MTWRAPVHYDKVPEAIDFRALAQRNQLKILESKDAISMLRRDVASYDSSKIGMASFDSKILC